MCLPTCAKCGALIAVLCGGLLSGLSQGSEQPLPEPHAPIDSGRLFQKGAKHLTLSAGVGFGMSGALTSVESHDLALATVEFGRILSETLAEGRWYQGNVELLGQVFGGAQWHPSVDYIIGAAPLLRYNFTPGWRVIPFLDVGAGLTATSIRNGSLSTTFEFNLQAGAGAHVLLRNDLALTLQYRFYHISNAGIDSPNAGVNTSTFLAGVTWFF